MELKKISSELQELTFEQACGINGGGGESAWYWVAYGVGAVVHGLSVFATEGGNNAGLCVH